MPQKKWGLKDYLLLKQNGPFSWEANINDFASRSSSRTLASTEGQKSWSEDGEFRATSTGSHKLTFLWSNVWGVFHQTEEKMIFQNSDSLRVGWNTDKNANVSTPDAEYLECDLPWFCWYLLPYTLTNIFKKKLLFPRPKAMGFASPYARRLPPVFELDVPWPLQTSTFLVVAGLGVSGASSNRILDQFPS